MVQVALPERPVSDPMAYVVAAARQAIDEAERWARARKHASDLNQLRAILDSGPIH